MKILVLIVIAYLLGSIPTGLWIGKFFYHVNLREHGSGNTGTTNTFRVLGPKAGTVTFIIDMLKGTVATLLPHILGVTAVSPILIGLLLLSDIRFRFLPNLKVVKLWRLVLVCFWDLRQCSYFIYGLYLLEHCISLA